MERALEKYPEARFIMHGGDIVENGNKLIEWEYFLDASKSFSAEIPFMAALGNHEVYGHGAETYRSLFQFPLNGPKGEEEFVYSFGYGDAHFMILNSEAANLEHQVEWLKEEVKKSTKKWNIVMFHRAPYHSNPLRGTDRTRHVFSPVIEELGIDLVLVGHDHAYMRTYPMKAGQPQKGDDAVGTTYVIGGSAGPKFYPGSAQEYTKILFAQAPGVEEGIQVYTAVTVNKNQLKLTVTSIHGQLVDEFTIKKPEEDREEVELERISLSGKQSMRPGERQTLEVRSIYNDGSEENVTHLVRLESSAPDIIDIGEQGQVEALKAGRAIVTARYQGHKAELEIVVTAGSSRNNRGGGGSSAPSTLSREPAGGNEAKSFRLGDVHFSIPANATGENITITVEKLTSITGFPLENAWKLVSDVFEISSNKAGKLDKAITITLPFDVTAIDREKQEVAIYWLDEKSQVWIKLESIQVNFNVGTVSGEIDHFTKFAVFAVDVGEIGVDEEDAEEGAEEVLEETQAGINFTDISGHGQRVISCA